jgi:hypothetical protein
MGLRDSLDTPVEESTESYEASEALFNARPGNGEAKSVTFGGLEFPPSGGPENGSRWLD